MKFPETLVEAVGTAVQVVGTFIGGQANSGVTQQEGRATDAVGVAANNSAEETAVSGAVAFCVVKTQNNVCQIAFAVGNKQRHKMCAEVGNCSGQFTTGYGVKRSLLTGCKRAEGCFHKAAPFIFIDKRGKMEVDVFSKIVAHFPFVFKPIFISKPPFLTFLEPKVK